MDKYTELIDNLVESEDARKIYDNYIVKYITYKEWIIGMVDNVFIWGKDPKWLKIIP
jgi:hypothetical protein